MVASVPYKKIRNSNNKENSSLCFGPNDDSIETKFALSKKLSPMAKVSKNV
jgi:hypothetical protein